MGVLPHVEGIDAGWVIFCVFLVALLDLWLISRNYRKKNVSIKPRSILESLIGKTPGETIHNIKRSGTSKTALMTFFNFSECFSEW